MQLDGQFARYSVAVECPEVDTISKFLYKKQVLISSKIFSFYSLDGITILNLLTLHVSVLSISRDMSAILDLGTNCHNLCRKIN